MSEESRKEIPMTFGSFEKGMNEGLNASLLGKNQLSRMFNATTRGGFVGTRSGWPKLILSWPQGVDSTTMRFQHADYYKPDVGNEMLMLMLDGRMFTVTPSQFSADIQEIAIQGGPNPSNKMQGWSVQAEMFWIYNDGESKPIYFDGSSAKRTGAQQLQPGTVITYAEEIGRLAYALPNGFSFRIADLVNGPNGTPMYQQRDSILWETENTFLNEGGNFSVPSNSGGIRAMISLSQIDTSTGQGPLQVFTVNSVYSVDAPVDRTTWLDVTYPIKTAALISAGALNHDGTVRQNSDIFFRSPDGIRSYVASRKEMVEWKNTPQSFEVSKMLGQDTPSLLQFGSGKSFDNRLLETFSPVYDDLGVYHRGLIALNFDEVSGIGTNAAPGYDGFWTGLNILKVVTGMFNGTKRCFLFARGKTNAVELWEVTSDDEGTVFDNGNVPIAAAVELPSYPFGNNQQLKRLTRGQLFAFDIIGPVAFSILYRPDDDECWHPWADWSVCSKYQWCTTDPPVCDGVPPQFFPQYRPRMGWGNPNPNNDCESTVPKILNDVYEAAIRIEFTGHCKIKKGTTFAEDRPQQPHLPCIGEQECRSSTCCPPSPFTYSADP
jgi:hypothetical protein